MTIVDFLLERLAEIEADARAATPGPWEWDNEEFNDDTAGPCQHRSEWCDHGPNLVTTAKLPPYADGSVSAVGDVITASGYDASSVNVTRADATHIARHDPAYVLADVAAKRAIVAWAADKSLTCEQDHPQFDVWHPEGHGPHPILRLLARPFADHEAFQEEWAL